MPIFSPHLTAGCGKPEGCCDARGTGIDAVTSSARSSLDIKKSFIEDIILFAAMFPSCYSKPADGSNKRISVAKVLLGVFVVYMLHSVWMLRGFFSTKSCDKGRGEQCITSYLGAKPRIQVG